MYVIYTVVPGTKTRYIIKVVYLMIEYLLLGTAQVVCYRHELGRISL